MNKVRECYSCVRLTIQVHFCVGFFAIFLDDIFLYFMSHLSNSIDIKNYCNQAQFLNKEIIMKCLRLKFLHEPFYNSQFKKHNYSELE